MRPAVSSTLRPLPLAAVLLLALSSSVFCADLAELRGELSKAMKRKQDAAVEQLIGEIIALRSAEAAEVLIQEVLLCGRPSVEALFREKIERCPDCALTHWLATRTNNHESAAVRAQLVQALTYRNEREAFIAILSALFDPVEGVKVAAVEAIATRDQRVAIPHLIRTLEQEIRLERELGQIAEQIRRLLNRWYGKKELFGPGEYRQIWEKKKDVLLDPNKKYDDEKLGGIEWVRHGTSVEPRLTPYFGEEIVTQRTVFVLDTSISMKIEDPVPPPEEIVHEDDDDEHEEERGGTSVGGGRSGERGGAARRENPHLGERQRLKRVQNEMVRLISDLPSDFQFTIISFDEEVTLFTSALQKATKKNKIRAIEFIRSFECGGETWTDKAMEAAFQVPNARTIVLLSDGQPYRSSPPIDVLAFLDDLDAMNRFENRKIETIGFRATAGTAGTFLKEVARRHRGSYTEIP